MTHLVVSWYVFLNYMRVYGMKEFLLKIILHDFLNLMLMFALFTKGQKSSLDLETIFGSYTYFLPLIGFTSGLLSWEIELLCNISESFILKHAHAITSRLILAALSSMLFFLFFLIGLLYFNYPTLDIIYASLLLPTFIMLGISTGFCFGFKHDKSINNWNYLVTWILALTPGLYWTEAKYAAQYFLPGSFIHTNLYWVEGIKIIAWITIALTLIAIGRRPKVYRVFSR